MRTMAVEVQRRGSPEQLLARAAANVKHLGARRQIQQRDGLADLCLAHGRVERMTLVAQPMHGGRLAGHFPDDL